jgi:hypothetical protein
MTVICTVDLPDEEEIDLIDTNGLDLKICAKCGGPVGSLITPKCSAFLSTCTYFVVDELLVLYMTTFKCLERKFSF